MGWRLMLGLGLMGRGDVGTSYLRKCNVMYKAVIHFITEIGKFGARTALRLIVHGIHYYETSSATPIETVG